MWLCSRERSLQVEGLRSCCFSGCSETQASPGLSVRFASMCCFSWLVRISQRESREEPQKNAALHQRPRWKTQHEPLGGSEVSLPVSSPCRDIIGSPLSLFPFVTGASQCKSMSLQCSSYIMRERQKRKEAALTHVVYCSVSVLKISLQRDLGRFWKYTHTHTHISRLHVWIFSSCLYRSY